jgi:hypothetical protein
MQHRELDFYGCKLLPIHIAQLLLLSRRALIQGARLAQERRRNPPGIRDVQQVRSIIIETQSNK